MKELIEKAIAYGIKKGANADHARAAVERNARLAANRLGVEYGEKVTPRKFWNECFSFYCL